MRRRDPVTMRKLATAATAAALLALTLAVGSTTASASGSTPVAKSAGAALKSHKPMRVGVECSCSGFGAASEGDYPDVVTAWQKYINSNGGINGYPVKVYLADDTGNAGTALRNAENLVKFDHVQAIVDVSDEDTAFEKYVAASGVPVTGGLSQSGPFSASPDWFPTNGGETPGLGYGDAAIAKAHGNTKFAALFCAELPVCAGFFSPFAKSLTNVIGGMSLAYQAVISASAPSYTAQCLAARQAGATAMIIGDSTNVANVVINDCAQQGIRFEYFVPGGTVDSTVLKDPNWQDLTSINWAPPADITSTPGGKLFNQIISRYYPKIRSTSDWDDSTLQVFAGLQLFGLDVTTNKLTPSSKPSRVKAGLYKLPSTTLEGLAPKLKYVKGKITQINCWFDVQIEGGKETEPDGPKAQCVPPSKVAALYKAWG
jgi:branched-chain amino acid transport system substrate-binding protein